MATTQQKDLDALFSVGAHFGYTRSRRHPSAAKRIFGTKDRNDIFDLEQTAADLERAIAFVEKLAGEGKQILIVGGKPEAAALVKAAAGKTNLPFVASRWIGGTLTNFSEVRGRIARLLELTRARETGEREKKYTKRERMMQDREIEELESRFGGLTSMEKLPAALFVVDPRFEDKAVREANQLGIPVIALANTDCDFNMLQYPIPANDSAVKSVQYFVDAFANAYRDSFRQATAAPEAPAAAPQA
ncbi:MAG TPA: 30S ribosomal protein S2 [Candidatus Paceibacterota bacterium]|nr:30S ribosomal protein S2 [Candidatus Paceibacterota bacterium]